MSSEIERMKLSQYLTTIPGSENIRERKGKKSDSSKTLFTPIKANVESMINTSNKTIKNLTCFLIRASSFSNPNLFPILEKRSLGYKE